MSSEKDFSDKNCDPQKGEINMERKIDPNKDSTGKTTIDTLSNLVDSLNIGNNQQKPQTNKSAQEFDLKNTVTIPEWLSDCETPFSWHLEQERGLGPELVIMRTLEKLDELLIEEPEFSLQRFVSLLKLILEYFVIGDIDKCCENMKIIDGCLEEEISRNDPLYQKVKLSLGHVVSATKAQVLFIIGKEEESKKIGRCIIPVKIMADVDKAALSSMKARFFLYSGYEDGEAVGVGYAKKALELEPGNPEWEYLLAKMLRQERRDIPFSNEVPRDELKLLESAVEKEKNPKYLVYLAQVYRECSQQAFKRYKNHPNFQGELQSSIERMAVKSLECYKEALTLCPDSPGVLRRVGYGIMNLPKKFADYNLALECLLKSLEISENQMTLHVLGTYYHRYGNDNVKALEYFERIAKTGSWFGLSDKIRIKWILDHNYDPVPDLEIGLSWKMKKNYRHQVLAQLGAYYLFIKRDFHKSLEYFKQVILEDKDAPQMTNFKSFFLRMNQPIDLYTYLVNEALLLVQKHDSSSTVEPETSDDESVVEPSVVGVGYVEDFLDLISQVRPELMEMTPDSELVPKLIQTSTEIENNCNRFNNRGRNNSRGNYSDNRGRGRGNYGNRGGNRRFTQEDGNERRGRYSYSNQRETPEDGNERRGRFSFANQRERGPEGGERRGGDRRGGFSRGKTQNWRPRPKNDQGGDDDKKDHENWRKK